MAESSVMVSDPLFVKPECYYIASWLPDPEEPPTEEPGEGSPFMELNEEGYFKNAFSSAVSTTDAAVVSNLVQLFFFGGLTDEDKALITGISQTGQMYKDAAFTFWPNGMARFSCSIQDDVYEAFCHNELFSQAVQKEQQTQYVYSVDQENGIVRLTNIENASDGLELQGDFVTGTFTRTFLLEAEIYHVNQEVSEEAPDRQEPQEPETPTVPDENQTPYGNISYGDDPRNTMDVFLPENLDTSRENGAFVVVYGGSWVSGNKEDMRSEIKRYTDAGYIAMAMNMRNCFFDGEKTTITVYDMLNDVQGSIRKLKSLSDENGWNIKHLAMTGTSSGANVAMLYAYSRNSGVSYFDTAEVIPVRFVIDIVGPVDMHDSAWYADEEWLEEDRTLLTEPNAGPNYAKLLTGMANKGELTDAELEECICSMSPVWYVDQFGGIPTIMGYSVRDVMQNPNNGKYLKAHLDARNVRNESFAFPNSLHGYFNDPEEAQALFDMAVEFAQTYFKESVLKEPEETEEPVVPEETGKPVVPEETGKPVVPEETGKPVAPEETEKPVAPEEPVETEKPSTPEVSGSQEVSAEASTEKASQPENIPINYVVKKGDTLSKIAHQHGLKLSDLIVMNPQIKDVNKIYPGQVITIGVVQTEGNKEQGNSAEQDMYYIVRRGDNLFTIARRHKMSLNKLRAMNPELFMQRYIYQGQKVKVK